MSRDLPQSPDLDHLKKQAKVLLKELLELSPTAKLADAQRVIARQYGFESWPKLKEHVERRKMAGAVLEMAQASLERWTAGQRAPAPSSGGVFSRYTEAARRAVFFASYECRRAGSPVIETEHLLLGLLRESGTSGRILKRSGLSPDEIRTKIQKPIPAKASAGATPPLSRDCKEALSFAAEEADTFGHDNIDIPHLLLGLLRAEHAATSSMLAKARTDLEGVRKIVLSIREEGGGSDDPR